MLGPDPKQREELRTIWADQMKQQYGKKLEEAKVRLYYCNEWYFNYQW